MAFTRMVFDIETAPLDCADAYLEPATAPANYKDPEKIAAYIEEKNAEALGRCALDPDLCRVVAIAAWREDRGASVAWGDADTDEAEMLADFWKYAEGQHYVGFNCLGFDLPVLLRRSLYLSVPAPVIQIDKYRHPQVDDLQAILSLNGALKLRGLAFYTKRFAINVPDDVNGADIPALVAAGEWDKVRGHVRADVEKTAQLAAALGYFSRSAVMAGLGVF